MFWSSAKKGYNTECRHRSEPADRQGGNRSAGEKCPVIGLLLQLFQLSLRLTLHSSTQKSTLSIVSCCYNRARHTCPMPSNILSMSFTCTYHIMTIESVVDNILKQHQAKQCQMLANQTMKRNSVAKNVQKGITDNGGHACSQEASLVQACMKRQK